MPDDPDHYAALAAAQTTVAGKIRALAAAGVPRADIARFLGKRYQHVRNVLEGDAQASSGGAGGGGYVLGHADLSGVREPPAPFRPKYEPKEIDRRSNGIFWLRVRPDWTLPLPEEFVAALEAEPGSRVCARLKDGTVTLVSSEAAADEARAAVQRIVPRGVSLVDSLIADRRAEAAREEEND